MLPDSATLLKLGSTLLALGLPDPFAAAALMAARRRVTGDGRQPWQTAAAAFAWASCCRSARRSGRPTPLCFVQHAQLSFGARARAENPARDTGTAGSPTRPSWRSLHGRRVCWRSTSWCRDQVGTIFWVEPLHGKRGGGCGFCRASLQQQSPPSASPSGARLTLFAGPQDQR